MNKPSQEGQNEHKSPLRQVVELVPLADEVIAVSTPWVSGTTSNI